MSPVRTALVADVGGTWARFALAEAGSSSRPSLGAMHQLAVAEHASFIDAARVFLHGLDGRQSTPSHAVLAVAGRVENEQALMTNHPWHVDARECASALGMRRVRLLNDFTAQALAVPHLGAADCVALGGISSPGKVEDSITYAVLGPGTGLGVSALLRRAGQQFALESEGGHAAFAPKTARQRAVLEHLSTRFERVSYERLISGGGLSNVHWALARIAGNQQPELLRPEQVTEHARLKDPLATEAVSLFCEVFGAFAGDLVLTFGGWDGVFLSGGLVPLLLEELKGDIFRRSFENKGRFSAALARVPVFAVTHPQAGLLGAAATAMQDLSESVHPRPGLQQTRIAS